MTELKIKDLGVKITKPRKLILEVLEKTNHPLSAKKLHRLLNNQIDLTSVYRNLKLFKDAGIIFKERLNNEDCFYFGKKQHHHVVCRICGKTTCIPCKHFYKKINGFTEIIHDLYISGICKHCNN